MRFDGARWAGSAVENNAEAHPPLKNLPLSLPFNSSRRGGAHLHLKKEMGNLLLRLFGGGLVVLPKPLPEVPGRSLPNPKQTQANPNQTKIPTGN